MKKIILIFISSLLLIIGCNKSTEPVMQEEQQEESLEYNGQMSFNYNGIQDTISIFAQPNGYVENEIVFRGSGEDLENTIMLTFKVINNGKTNINDTMTGYWDLGLCIPINKYLLTNQTDNYIQINSYNAATKEIEGEFNLRFRYEDDSTKTVTFSKGNFKAKINTNFPFHYCIEG
jgi:hypothetical protein